MQTIVIPIRITGFANKSQPGWVWCQVEDLHGQLIKFVEKIPVVTNEDVWSESQYPRDGEIECDLITIRNDAQKGKIAVLSLAVPKNLESSREDIRFELRIP